MRITHIKHLYLIFTLCIGLLLISSNAKHDYYISVTNIEYVEEQQSLQIISQIFIDDLEKLIRERYDETITLGENIEPKMVDDYIKRYLRNRLKITINGTRPIQ